MHWGKIQHHFLFRKGSCAAYNILKSMALNSVTTVFKGEKEACKKSKSYCACVFIKSGGAPYCSVEGIILANEFA